MDTSFRRYLSLPQFFFFYTTVIFFLKVCLINWPSKISFRLLEKGDIIRGLFCCACSIHVLTWREMEPVRIFIEFESEVD